MNLRHALAPLLLSCALLGAFPAPGAAYNCGNRPWQAIAVTLTDPSVGASSTYTIATAVPALAGCDLTTHSVVSVTLPSDSDAASISGGNLNGTPVTFLNMSGQTVQFLSPLAVANDQPVAIVLSGVTNPSAPGSKMLHLSAAPVQNGSIGDTVSGAYDIVAPSPTPTQTATRTATVTPSSTSTPTASPTPTPQGTSTATPTATPVPHPCSAAATTNPCIPGGGSSRTDCHMEWITTPVSPRHADLMPANALICYEGDPRCDFDADLLDGNCTFHTQICINNTDPRFPCGASDLVTFELKSPNPTRGAHDAADLANIATLEQEAGPGGFGVTVLHGSTPVFIGRSNNRADQCSQPMSIHVPLRIRAGNTRKGSKRLRVRGIDALRAKDTDTLTLTCRPSTCGDRLVQTDHETCDDGNRINGDGCDQGCQLENATPTATASVAGGTSTPTPTESTPMSTSTPTNTPPAGVPSPTPSASPTITSSAGPVCGDANLDPGETCDDGNTITNPPSDTCPADCTIVTCTPEGTQRIAAISFSPPAGTNVASITVLLEYPDGTVQIPGTRDDDSVGASITNPPSGYLLAAFDYDYALSVGLAGTRALTPGQIFRVNFDDCQTVPPPIAANFRCTVIDASNTAFQPVNGVTCVVTLP